MRLKDRGVKNSVIARETKYDKSKRSRGTARDTLLATPPVGVPDASSSNQ